MVGDMAWGLIVAAIPGAIGRNLFLMLGRGTADRSPEDVGDPG